MTLRPCELEGSNEAVVQLGWDLPPSPLCEPGVECAGRHTGTERGWRNLRMGSMDVGAQRRSVAQEPEQGKQSDCD